jgi:hypothetical protein
MSDIVHAPIRENSLESARWPFGLRFSKLDPHDEKSAASTCIR